MDRMRRKRLLSQSQLQQSEGDPLWDKQSARELASYDPFQEFNEVTLNTIYQFIESHLDYA